MTPQGRLVQLSLKLTSTTRTITNDDRRRINPSQFHVRVALPLLCRVSRRRKLASPESSFRPDLKMRGYQTSRPFKVWLWSLSEPERLNSSALALLSDWHNQLYLSTASVWEISIKAALGKLPLPESPVTYITSRMQAQGILALNITCSHALEVFWLPLHHRDPFDRMLIAQSKVESLPILTADPMFGAYDVEIAWSGT